MQESDSSRGRKVAEGTEIGIASWPPDKKGHSHTHTHSLQKKNTYMHALKWFLLCRPLVKKNDSSLSEAVKLIESKQERDNFTGH